MLQLLRLEPDTSYASFWWVLGIIGIGFGFTGSADCGNIQRYAS